MFYDIRDQKIGCVPRVLCAVVSSEVYASTAFSSSQINQVSVIDATQISTAKITE